MFPYVIKCALNQINIGPKQFLPSKYLDHSFIYIYMLLLVFSVCTHIWGPFNVLIVDKMLKFKFVHMSCRFLACWTGVKMYDFINLCIGFGDWAALDFYGALRSRTYDRSISKVCYILIEIVRDFLDPFWFFFLSLFVCVRLLFYMTSCTKI